MRSSNASGLICLSVLPCLSLTLESLDLEISFFWYAGMSSEYPSLFRISRSLGEGQGHRSKNSHTSVTRYTYSRVVRLRLKGNLVSSATGQLTGGNLSSLMAAALSPSDVLIFFLEFGIEHR